MPPRPRKPKPELTTAQRLAAIIKRARDIMRVDAGLNGDLDRIPQLAWLLFLKAFDDLEDSREITDSDFSPVIPKQWRWRTWAGNRKLTGSDLIDFVNGDLLPGLRNLAGTAATRSQADVVKAIFNGMDNRMRSGAQLRLLVDSLDQIHFNSSDDIHTMAFLYESMLREMRDAAGDSGEFYTPRPLIRFMVQRSAPKQGEKVLDPAAGTGGFLVEALTELEPRASSVAKRRALHKNVQGVEKKPLPYLLGTMNLLLHGVDEPVLVMENALRYLRDGSTRTQVDLILTNPPFGGAETKEIIATFPKGQQAAETTWLFLVTILEKLKPRGRCAVVVPNSVLFDTGVTASGIKKKLMDTCDLHTILR
ncbi:MAG TPA: class I SAM-dependent DNA methyltransferase, partial [Nakamurella sp.]